MIKLIFSKVEDISKIATFLEKNFITVIYLSRVFLLFKHH